jgi:hypothetical protein
VVRHALSRAHTAARVHFNLGNLAKSPSVDMRMQPCWMARAAKCASETRFPSACPTMSSPCRTGPVARGCRHGSHAWAFEQTMLANKGGLKYSTRRGPLARLILTGSRIGSYNWVPSEVK